MTKTSKTIYACAACGSQYAKWQGRCQECGAWGTLGPETAGTEATKTAPGVSADQPINLAELPLRAAERLTTKLIEIDRVLGGGLVKGSVTVLGGDPGIGKSTLALEIAKNIDGALYVSGEESAQQIKIRGQRLGLNLPRLQFINQTNVGKITATAKKFQPPLLIIDSIQMMESDEALSGRGSAGQLIAAASQLIELAKTTAIPVIIIGHVTKEGNIAGPKTLEHLVDVVLYLENDNQNYYKILRATKNRFGSTGEIGILEMRQDGLKEITSPEEIFIGQNRQTANAGAVTTAVVEGSRVFLVEIQALTTKTAFGYPQRKASGFDLNRLQMIIAILAKNAKINLGNQDVYLNVAGGLKIKDTASDLAVALAVVSAFLNLPLAATLAVGELGLSGDVRNVAQAEKRIKEAQKMKFKKIILPAAAVKQTGQDLIKATNIQEAIRLVMGRSTVNS